MQLCLGTVQFGMDYGIKNQKQPSLEQCIEMLDYAIQNGIDNIDTTDTINTIDDNPNKQLTEEEIAALFANL